MYDHRVIVGLLALICIVLAIILGRLFTMPTLDDLKAGQAYADAVDELASIEQTMTDLATKLADAVSNNDSAAIEAISADLTAHAQATSAAVQAAKPADGGATG